MKIAIIGIDHMGDWFSRDFLKDGHQPAIFDLDREKLQSHQHTLVLKELVALADFVVLQNYC